MKFLFRFVDWPLRIKMAALLTVVSLLPLLVTEWLDLRQASERLLLDTQQRLQAHAAQIGRDIDAIDARNRQAAAGLARLPGVLTYCRAGTARRPGLVDPARELLRLPSESDDNVVGAALLDTAGTVLLASTPTLSSMDPRVFPFFRSAANGHAAIGEVLANDAGPPEALLAYLGPVLRADGSVACVAALWERTAEIAEVLRPTQHLGALSASGAHALLVDSLGIQIGPAGPDARPFQPSVARPGSALAGRVSEGIHDRAIAAAPDEALFRTVDPVDRSAVFAVARRLDSAPWTVFALLPEAGFVADIDRLRRQEALIALTAMAMSIAVGVLFSRHLVTPIAALAATTRQVASDDRVQRPRERRGDEFGGLARSIEIMADRMKAQRDVLEHTRAILDERVRERSSALEGEVAKRHLAQAAIRRSQGLLQAIVDNTASLVCVKDLSGRYVLANRQFCEVHRVDHADLLGRTDHQQFAAELADARSAADAQVVAGGGTVVAEESVSRADGVHTYVAVRCPLPDEHGRPCGVIGISTDITEHKTMAGRLQSQLARLQILDQVTAAIAGQHPVASVYRAMLRHLEARMPVDFGCVCLADPLQERWVLASVGPKSRPLAERVGLKEGDKTTLGFPGVSDGTQRVRPATTWSHTDSPLSTRLAEHGLGSQMTAPLKAEGKVFGMLVVGRVQLQGFSSDDQAFLRQLGAHVALAARQTQLHLALKKAYDDLRQTQQAAMQQDRLRALGQMASGIAHDINNAIAPVSLYAESLLQREPHLTERGRRHLGTMSRAIDDVAATVARMREFYRQRHEPQVMAPIALDTLLREVVDLTHARWSDMPQQRGIVVRLRTEFAPDLPPVKGVESELREALINLVLNAVDAMPEGGLLVLRTGTVLMLDAAEQETRRICIDVSDSGVGMEAHTLLHCLEPFFTTKGERGTGLGLAMVYGAMQRHFGEVKIDSEPGVGTTVRLVFPQPPATERKAVPTVALQPQVPRLDLLLIDDDPVMLGSLGDALGSDGHLIVTATDGQAGIDTFRKHLHDQPFDMVVTDLGMPYVDGRQVADAIKAMSETTPVIMLTGWGERMLATGDMPARVDLLLGKPVRLQDLRAALGRLAQERTRTLSKEIS